jgi:hypothetical protein
MFPLAARRTFRLASFALGGTVGFMVGASGSWTVGITVPIAFALLSPLVAAATKRMTRDVPAADLPEGAGLSASDFEGDGDRCTPTSIPPDDPVHRLPETHVVLIPTLPPRGLGEGGLAALSAGADQATFFCVGFFVLVTIGGLVRKGELFDRHYNGRPWSSYDACPPTPEHLTAFITTARSLYADGYDDAAIKSVYETYAAEWAAAHECQPQFVDWSDLAETGCSPTEEWTTGDAAEFERLERRGMSFSLRQRAVSTIRSDFQTRCAAAKAKGGSCADADAGTCFLGPGPSRLRPSPAVADRPSVAAAAGPARPMN